MAGITILGMCLCMFGEMGRGWGGGGGERGLGKRPLD